MQIINKQSDGIQGTVYKVWGISILITAPVFDVFNPGSKFPLIMSVCFDLPSMKEAALLQTLLNLASPRTAHYMGHILRPDHTYRVVVRKAGEFRTLTISKLMLSLVDAGILVDQDRACVLEQLT